MKYEIIGKKKDILHAELTQKAEDWAEARGYPPLAGTPKQIAWAGVCRMESIIILEKFRKESEQDIKDLKINRPELMDIIDDFFYLLFATCDEKIKDLEECTSCNILISTRHYYQVEIKEKLVEIWESRKYKYIQDLEEK